MTDQRNDAVREAATLAVCRGIYGPGYDPFQHPEGYDFCEKIAASVLAAVRPRSQPPAPSPLGNQAIWDALRNFTLEDGRTLDSLFVKGNDKINFCCRVAALSTDAGSGDKLPCDVRLPPATTIRAGCTFETLRIALSAPDRPKHFPETAGERQAREVMQPGFGSVAAPSAGQSHGAAIAEAGKPAPSTIDATTRDNPGWHAIEQVDRDALEAIRASDQTDGALLTILVAHRMAGEPASVAVEAVKEECAKVALSYIDGLKPAVGWTDDQVRWWEFGVTDAATAIASAIRALPLSKPTPASVAAGVERGTVERMAYGYELMFRAICNIAGTSGERESWYRQQANEMLERVVPLHSLRADSNPHKPGDCLTQYKRFGAAVEQESLEHFAIRVEKLLCEKLGREWTATGISIASLVDELSTLSKPTPVEAGLAKLVREYRPTMDKEVLHSWAQDILAALSETLPPPPQEEEA